jgi:hypothetical protein
LDTQTKEPDMNDQHITRLDVSQTPSEEKTCGCGPDCRCGDTCACGPNGTCAPACPCAD